MVDDTFKDAVLDVLEPNEAPDVGLDVAPSVETEMVACPACACGDCEAWEPELGSKVAKCPECQAEFPVRAMESASRAAIINIVERRLKLRRQMHAQTGTSSAARQDATKAEVLNLLAA